MIGGRLISAPTGGVIRVRCGSAGDLPIAPTGAGFRISAQEFCCRRRTDRRRGGACPSRNRMEGKRGTAVRTRVRARLFVMFGCAE